MAEEKLVKVHALKYSGVYLNPLLITIHLIKTIFCVIDI